MEIKKFKEVYDKFFRMVFSVAYRIVKDEQLTEDICQEVFLKLYQYSQRIADVQHMVYWLIRVTKNTAFSVAARSQRETKAYQRLNTVNSSESAETVIVQKNEQERLQKAILRLPQQYRAAILLKEYSFLSYREIANILDISENNAKIRVFRARQKLAKTLKERM